MDASKVISSVAQLLDQVEFGAESATDVVYALDRESSAMNQRLNKIRNILQDIIPGAKHNPQLLAEANRELELARTSVMQEWDRVAPSAIDAITSLKEEASLASAVAKAATEKVSRIESIAYDTITLAGASTTVRGATGTLSLSAEKEYPTPSDEIEMISHFVHKAVVGNQELGITEDWLASPQAEWARKFATEIIKEVTSHYSGAKVGTTREYLEHIEREIKQEKLQKISQERMAGQLAPHEVGLEPEEILSKRLNAMTEPQREELRRADLEANGVSLFTKRTFSFRQKK